MYEGAQSVNSLISFHEVISENIHGIFCILQVLSMMINLVEFGEKIAGNSENPYLFFVHQSSCHSMGLDSITFGDIEEKIYSCFVSDFAL